MSRRMAQPFRLIRCAALHCYVSPTTSPSATSCAMARKLTAAEQEILNSIKVNKDKTAPMPPDVSRVIEMDPRDPRAKESWPCRNNHVPSNWQKNPQGMWRHCQVCNLDHEAVICARQGSPSSSAQAMNHVMVQRMLHELEPMMKGRMLTAPICKAIMDKVTADVQQLSNHPRM